VAAGGGEVAAVAIFDCDCGEGGEGGCCAGGGAAGSDETLARRRERIRLWGIRFLLKTYGMSGVSGVEEGGGRLRRMGWDAWGACACGMVVALFDGGARQLNGSEMRSLCDLLNCFG